MARVVQQRSGPPYLLIVFVFLFLVATTMAVLFYTKYDTALKDSEKQVAVLNSLANDSQLRLPAIAKMRDAYEKTGRGGKTVVQQLSADIDKLTEVITGSNASSPAAAIAGVEGLYKAMGEQIGLIDEITKLLEKQQQLAAEKKDLAAQLLAKTEEVKLRDKSVEDVKDQLSKEIASLKSQLGEQDKARQADQQGYAEKLKGVDLQYQERITQQGNRITDLVGQVEGLNTVIARKDKEINELTAKIGIGRRKFGETTTPDGRILKVLDEAGICYIDLGAKDRLQPGVSFAVYSPVGSVEQADSKANIVVVDVKDDLSKCRIVRQTKDNPIAVGDVISNVAFDRIRTHRFYVEGLFDVAGTGTATEDGAKIIKMLIERNGGKVVDTLDSVDTDFAVFGQKPFGEAGPAQPPEGATPADYALYTDRKRIHEHYKEAKRKAEELRIEPLDTNRFLSMIGYVPEQTLK